MMVLRIRGFLPNTLIDWPGRLAAEVFLEGCNLRCPYCHAGYLLTTAPEAETFELEHVLAHLKGERGWLDGVVVSGGEPTIHPELPALLRGFKEAGFAVKLDTNGTCPVVLASLMRAGVLDYVAMDIKAPPEKYDKICGVPVDQGAIDTSITLLMDGHVDYEFRTTIIPQLTREDILAIGNRIRGARSYVLQQCRRPDSTASFRNPQPEQSPPTPTWILEATENLKTLVRSSTTRGFNMSRSLTSPSN